MTNLRPLTPRIITQSVDQSILFQTFAALYPQNGDRVVTIDFVTLFHPMNMQQGTKVRRYIWLKTEKR